tara:strand:+ start:2975 stop:3505 length:531 start_codon:yes stop_codon:yes gene_type:complete
MKLKINELILNKDNPRIIKDDKFKKLVKSIKEFPQMLELRPIVIDEDNIILGGNMRYRACMEAGLKEVPVKIAKGLTEEQKREFIIKDNASFGEWEWDILGNEWNTKELDNWGIDVWQNTDDLEEPDFNELTDSNSKDAVIKITFKNEEHLEDAEKEIANIVNKYEKAFYSVSSEK